MWIRKGGVKLMKRVDMLSWEGKKTVRENPLSPLSLVLSFCLHVNVNKINWHWSLDNKGRHWTTGRAHRSEPGWCHIRAAAVNSLVLLPQPYSLTKYMRGQPSLGSPGRLNQVPGFVVPWHELHCYLFTTLARLDFLMWYGTKLVQ